MSHYINRKWRGWFGVVLWTAALDLYPGDPVYASWSFWLRLFGTFLLLYLGSLFVERQRFIDDERRIELMEALIRNTEGIELMELEAK